jgi:transglutaminase-like putative cysteine protease
MAGTFEIVAVSPDALPIIPEPVFHSNTYEVALDKPITPRENALELRLRVSGNPELVRTWDTARLRSGEWLIETRSGTTRPAAPDAHEKYLREELSYPLQHPSVRDLAFRAVDRLGTPLEKAAQLTEFVHAYINYDHHSTMQNVLDVIRSQRGDCNEYAEMFTTLSRAIGIPARTVIGLAYTDENRPAFALHAWNEVLVNNSWHAFDPTWNESNVDATHIPLPEDDAGSLLGIVSLRELRFELLKVRYL